jgi:hypothetical protein
MTTTSGPEHRFEGQPPLLWYTTRPPDLPASPKDRRATQRRWLFDALACLALASLVFSEASREALHRPDFDFYSALPVNAPTLRALVLNVLGSTAVGLAVVSVLRRARRLVWRRLGAVLAAATTIVALNAVRTTYPARGGWTDALDVRLFVGVAVVVLAASGAWPRHALYSIRRFAIVVSPLAVLTLLSTLWMFLEVARTVPWRRTAPPPSLNATAPSLRRVVWVLLDDLDPRVAFEARPAGLALPELDRLRAHALYADAVRLPALPIDVSIATLVTGRRVLSATAISGDDLELKVADDRPARWSAQPNVFSRARALGYNTALVGWHLPYARVFAGGIHVVHWWPSIAHDRTRADTFGEAFTRQWASLAPPVYVRRLYAERLAAAGDLALRTATDGRLGFVLLHLPIPSLPGVYDPVNGRLTTWSFGGADAEYLDNLELVDRFVGDLRRGLERGRLTDRTWVVLSSARSRTGADGRVPFLVRAPDGDAAHVDSAFDARVTQDLVISVLRGSTADTDDVVRWLARVPAPRSK